MNMYDKMVADVPQLVRGIVWCHTCGRQQTVSSAHCLAVGWPKCHGQTMSIDSPGERKRLAGREDS